MNLFGLWAPPQPIMSSALQQYTVETFRKAEGYQTQVRYLDPWTQEPQGHCPITWHSDRFLEAINRHHLITRQLSRARGRYYWKVVKQTAIGHHQDVDDLFGMKRRNT